MWYLPPPPPSDIFSIYVLYLCDNICIPKRLYFDTHPMIYVCHQIWLGCNLKRANTLIIFITGFYWAQAFAHNNSQQLILASVGSHWLASRSRYHPFINFSNTYLNFSVNSFRLSLNLKGWQRGKEQFKQVSWSRINFPSRLKLDCYISNFLHSINYLHKLLPSEIGILSRGIKHKWTKCYICICILHGQPACHLYPDLWEELWK